MAYLCKAIYLSHSVAEAVQKYCMDSLSLSDRLGNKSLTRKGAKKYDN